MSYKETILSQNPLSFWPLDDDTSLGIAQEATGLGNDATYSGNIFDKAIPLISNGIHGTRLVDSTSTITYPLPGAQYVSGSWISPGIWAENKEEKPFALEAYFKLETNDLNLTEDIIVLGNIEAGNKYGIYLSKNRIYFKPNPDYDYFVSYEVEDWKRRFHVVANYSKTQISLMVNGKYVQYRYSDEVVQDFQFSITNGTIYSAGSNSYPLTLDAIAIYGYNFDKVRVEDHSDLSRKSVTKSGYYNANSQVYYLPDNSECQLSYKFVNNWANFEFINSYYNERGNVSLRYLDDLGISSGSASFISLGGRTCLSLSNDQYLDISSVISLANSGVAISVSFYHTTGASEYAILSLSNSTSSQDASAYVDDSEYLVINLNGQETVTTVGPDAGWNELVITNSATGFNVYLNEDLVYESVDLLFSVTNAYIGRVNELYSNKNISWIAVKSNISRLETLPNTLYGLESDFILKLTGNLKWSQFGYANGVIYVPSYDYDGSLAFYTASSNNVSVTYNNGLVWPKMGSLPGLLDDPVGQVNLYEVAVKLSTDDSKNDLPILRNLGLYVYAEDMKRVISENSYDVATIYNKDNAIIFDDEVQFLDRLDQAGIRLSGNSYLSVPSQSKNFDTGGFNGTKSVSLAFKINEPLTAGKYILKSGTKELYWDGSQWVHTGFNEMYVNGQSNYEDEAFLDDWVYVTLTSTSKINAGDNIYIGADASGNNQTDITLGAFAMAAYTLDQYDAETEYEVFVGFPQEDIVTDTIQLNVIDYGLIPHRFAFQRA